MHSLPLFVKIADQSVILIGTGDAADTKRRLIERAGGMAVDETNQSARIAFIALDDEREAADAASRLKARGLLVNVVDRPALCDFTTPAIIDRDPVLIAVGTGGASAGLAAALRQRLEDMLPSGLGMLAKALKAARTQMRMRWPDSAERRRALARALSPGGRIDPLGANANISSWLDDPSDAATPETLAIDLRSDDPEDLTIREARALAMADRILHDPHVPEGILARARADAPRLVLAPDEPPGDHPGTTVILRVTPM